MNTKQELAALAAAALAAGAKITRVKKGARSLDLTDREWAERVKMTKDEIMALDMLGDDGYDEYKEYEKEQQAAWAAKYAA